MTIPIASSLMQCAILSAHLYLVERLGGSIALPGLNTAIAGTQHLHLFLCCIEESLCFRSCEIT